MSAPARRRRSRLRKLALQLALVAAALLAVEGGLRVAGLGPAAADDPYVGFDGVVRLFEPDPADPAWLVTAPARLDHFNPQRFAARKPPGTRRVFCLGGSTTYGRPYTDSTSFAGWLRELLPLADPETHWEVVNAGGVSYASYRVAVILDELAAYEPDLFVIYTGHNEFLEQRTYGDVLRTPGLLLRVGAALRETALFSVARRLAGTAPQQTERFVLGAEVETILDQSVGPEAYVRDDELTERVLEHFRASLERMVDTARAAGAEVLLVLPASQLDDCAPFKSAPDAHVPADVVARIEGQLALPESERDLAALAELAAVAPRHAGLQYALGRALLADADVPGARAALLAARDEDLVPLRASTRVQTVVREVAEARAVPWADAVALTDALAAQRTGTPIPGEEVFLDHVHMTAHSNLWLAKSILLILGGGGWLDPRIDWTDSIPVVSARVQATLTTEDHVRALSRLAAVLDWAGKADEAERHTRRALELSGGGDAMSLWLLGNAQLERGELDGAIDAYERALQVDPGYTEAHLNLAMALLQQADASRTAEALAHAEQAERLGGVSARTAFARGLASERLGRASEAEQAYAEAAAQPGGHADASNRLGLAAMARGDRPAALAAFAAAADADPRAARPLYNLGQLLAADGRLDEAIQAWRDALAREPGHAGAHARLGSVLAERGELREALTHLDAALAARPADVELAADRERVRAALELIEGR